jgi:hypothetical protein
MVALVGLGCVLSAADPKPVAPAPTDYRMSEEESLAKFGMKLSEIPERPLPRLAPIPPFPFKMRQEKREGWSEYVIQIKASGTVGKVVPTGYSAKEFQNAGPTLEKWRFSDGANPGLYRVKLRYVLDKDGNADVLWK